MSLVVGDLGLEIDVEYSGQAPAHVAKETLADARKAKVDLGWEPSITLEEALPSMAQEAGMHERTDVV